MEDWKKKIDQEEARRRAEQEERSRKSAEEWSRKVQQQIEQEAREYQQNLGVHKQKFKCKICGRSSDGPVRYEVTTSIYDHDRYVGEQSTGQTEIQWNSPTGLQSCQVCHEWVCDAHIYKGICKSCAQSRY